MGVSWNVVVSSGVRIVIQVSLIVSVTVSVCIRRVLSLFGCFVLRSRVISFEAFTCRNLKT